METKRKGERRGGSTMATSYLKYNDDDEHIMFRRIRK
jgi:hypothetical protein